MPSVQDIVNLMEDLAPTRLAESWDAVGLQVGRRDWPVRSIRVALDPLPEVVAAACDQHVDLLITHHPLLFQPVKNLDFSSLTGSILYQATVNQLAVYCAHTNLDKVSGGLNDILAKRIGLDQVDILSPSEDAESCKLVLYVPADYEQQVLSALFQTSAGIIGEYSCCAFRNPGKGSFLPGDRARPFIGKPGQISHVDEIRIETLVNKKDISAVLSHVRSHHPYQTMAFDVYPLLPVASRHGFGRTGTITERMTLLQFAQTVKEKLCLPNVKISGKPDMMVQRAAICSGSGSSLLNAFFASTADVYISGDLRYHDARAAESAGKALLDIGHFSSEHLMIEPVCDYLRQRISNASWEVCVEAYQLEKDPFTMI
ncbi:MAG: Nif3-like dinuclear metal center hexameric protein [Deltaproteobacteria bacterium]|nr:Nif3-like dinuclear metal center hexameric protein [Deltaproteobacteria bacterium]